MKYLTLFATFSLLLLLHPFSVAHPANGELAPQVNRCSGSLEHLRSAPGWH